MDETTKKAVMTLADTNPELARDVLASKKHSASTQYKIAAELDRQAMMLERNADMGDPGRMETAIFLMAEKLQELGGKKIPVKRLVKGPPPEFEDSDHARDEIKDLAGTIAYHTSRVARKAARGRDISSYVKPLEDFIERFDSFLAWHLSW